VVLLRISKTNAFPVPPIIVADSYRVSLRAAGPAPQKLSGALTIKTNGSDELPLWRVRPGLPSWLSVAVTRNGKNQTFTNTVSTAGLKEGFYHAVVRADNAEPLSGKPMSSLYYDVDLEVAGDAGGSKLNPLALSPATPHRIWCFGSRVPYSWGKGVYSAPPKRSVNESR
jgi:hypothetical protein